MIHLLLNLLFPPASLDGAEGEHVTSDELRSLKGDPFLLSHDVLRRSGMPSIHSLAAAARYGGSPLLRTAIWRFKYRRMLALEQALGSVLQGAADLLPIETEAVLCPVPLHWSRQFSRGFNQSQLLAQAVASRHGCRVTELLRRTRATGHQAHRKRSERGGAVYEAFVMRINADVPDHVILVDDICTTGSTLEACASALKQAGVRRIDALVLAVG